MGIGVHTGEVVVGNLGSHRRMKYGVVGSHANLTSRVESYTIGGQILISEATLQETGPILQVGRSFEVEAKGVDKPLRLYEVRGIRGEYGLFLSPAEEELLPLQPEIFVRYSLLEGKHLSGTVFEGRVVRLSVKRGEICCENVVPLMSNIRMQLVRRNGEELVGNLYGKVLEHLCGSDKGFSVRFTSALSESALLTILRC
jgi:adenylate cyclase